MDTLKYLQNKYNLDLSAPSPIEIPNVGRLDFVRWIRELDLTTGAEVGVEKALFSHLLSSNNPQLLLYGVDPYLFHKEYREYSSQDELDGIFEEAKVRMKSALRKKQYIFIRKPSMEAVKSFEDNSLDFVYLDGNHEAPHVQQDIEEWAKKVRPGGVVAGHDYVRVKNLNFDVKDALRVYTENNGIKTWFVLGSYAKKRGEIRDRSRSWMFIKP